MGGKMNQLIRVVPAVLTDDAAALKKMLLQAGTYTDYVQIDIMDNKFVPSRSITWEEIAAIRPKIKWEAHLMVEQPEKQLENFKKAGATKAIFHFEATSNPDDVISAARQLGIGIGVALNPETPVTRITRFIDKVDSVLFLSVHPGFYGAKFIPEVLDKIVELRQQYPEINIGIDGGIKESNIAQIARKGVNEIFVGSAILLQPDPGESYRKLNLLAQTNTGNR
jgi:ribulose-phosphate 3-epimerase